MNPGDLVTFRAAQRSRENLPVLRATVVGQPIEPGDQLGVLRIVSGDRVRIAEIREDFALVKHARFTAGLCLVSVALLELIPTDLQTRVPHEEDAKL